MRYYSSWRGANGILLFVDVTRRESFDNLQNWFSIIERYAHMNVRVVIVASKCDEQSTRQVWNEQILDFASRIVKPESDMNLDVQCIETSALNNYNIMEAIYMITRSILKLLRAELDPKFRLKNKEKARCITM